MGKRGRMKTKKKGRKEGMEDIYKENEEKESQKVRCRLLLWYALIRWQAVGAASHPLIEMARCNNRTSIWGWGGQYGNVRLNIMSSGNVPAKRNNSKKGHFSHFGWTNPNCVPVQMLVEACWAQKEEEASFNFLPLASLHCCHTLPYIALRCHTVSYIAIHCHALHSALLPLGFHCFLTFPAPSSELLSCESKKIVSPYTHHPLLPQQQQQQQHPHLPQQRRRDLCHHYHNNN